LRRERQEKPATENQPRSPCKCALSPEKAHQPRRRDGWHPEQLEVGPYVHALLLLRLPFPLLFPRALIPPGGGGIFSNAAIDFGNYPVRKPSAKQSVVKVEERQTIAVNLIQDRQTQWLPPFVFRLDKSVEASAHHVGLAVSDGRLLWPVSIELKSVDPRFDGWSSAKP
jgi:hypothetical protein